MSNEQNGNAATGAQHIAMQGAETDTVSARAIDMVGSVAETVNASTVRMERSGAGKIATSSVNLSGSGAQRIDTVNAEVQASGVWLLRAKETVMDRSIVLSLVGETINAHRVNALFLSGDVRGNARALVSSRAGMFIGAGLAAGLTAAGLLARRK